MGIARLPPQARRKYKGRLDDAPGIFSLMDPMATTAPWANPSAWSDKRLILSHHKNLNHGHYLIDDRTKHGVAQFAGEHIHFGAPRFPHWTAVLEYLAGKP